MYPLVSVIVPTYQRPVRLRKALESIAAQTFKDFETIVINDGGEDVRDVINDFKRVHYINCKENRGLPAARNIGIKAAKSRFIAYLDDDDWFYPHHLATLASYALQHKARFVYSNADAVFHNGRVGIYVDREYDPEKIKQQNITPVCCVLHERSLIDKAGSFDESLPNHEDWDLWIRMSKYAEPIHIHETTCCIDRSRATMSSDINKMRKGFEFIRARYLETA